VVLNQEADKTVSYSPLIHYKPPISYLSFTLETVIFLYITHAARINKQ